MKTTVIIETKARRFKYAFDDCEIVVSTLGDTMLVEITPFNQEEQQQKQEE